MFELFSRDIYDVLFLIAYCLFEHSFNLFDHFFQPGCFQFLKSFVFISLFLLVVLLLMLVNLLSTINSKWLLPEPIIIVIKPQR